MRIVTTYAWYKPAGLAKRLSRAVIALADAGIDVDYATIAGPPERHHRLHLQLLGAPSRLAESMPNHENRYPWLFYMWRATWTCLRCARKPDVECLVTFSYGATFPMLLARLITRKPLVIFLRSNERQENVIKGVSWPLRVVFGCLEWLAARTATRLVPITKSLAQVMKDRHGARVAEKAVVLHNDLPAPDGDRKVAREEVRALIGRSDTRVFAASGPLNKVKNFGSLIEAVAKVGDPRIHLLLMGAGQLRQTLEQQAVELGVENRVTFAGWRDDVPRLLAGSDFFVQPSFTEGMSNSLLEALAAGVPCLISDIPEHAELFDESPVLTDPRDVEALSRKMAAVVHDEAFRAQVTQDCRKVAEKLRFDWDARVVSIVEQVASS